MIGSRITGALMTSLSSTIANGLPTLASLTWAKRRVPVVLKVKLTTHSPVCWFRPAVALVRSPPSTSMRLRTMIGRGLPSGPRSLFDGSTSAPGSARPLAGIGSWLTSRKVIFAVLPRMSLTRAGSWMPGNCTRMRSPPWRAMTGSVTPV